MPDKIEIRGAKAHNLKNIDVDIPLGKIVGIAGAPLLRGINLADACKMTLSELIEWVKGVPASLPEPMRPMALRHIFPWQTKSTLIMDAKILLFFS